MTATLTRPSPMLDPRPSLSPAGELNALLAEAGSLVERLEYDDQRWEVVGPALTRVVDVVRRGTGGSPSPVPGSSAITPILRLRDLARAAERLCRFAQATVPSAAVREGRRHVRLLRAAVEA
ncbi:MAG: hypothetical protein R3249_09030 [Nitriliruptorales bacterium]|nr:hypothetical protein [Nitriliruptorales bacterium]